VHFSRLWTVMHISRVNYAEMAGDRPRQHAHEIFGIVDFSGIGPKLLHLTRPAHAGVKDGYPFKKW